MEKIIIFILLILNVNFVYSEENKKNRTVIFNQVVSSKNMGPMFKAKTWMKAKKIRMEYIDRKKPMISIIDETSIHNYDPEEKRGAVLPVSKGNAFIGTEIMRSKEEFVEFLEYMEAEIIGMEIVDDKECDIYKYADIEKNIIHKIWVWKKEFFPIKAAIKTLDNNDVITVLYNNVKIGADISDSLFNVPSDVLIQKFR